MTIFRERLTKMVYSSKALATFIALSTFSAASAQDVIMKKTGEEVQAKVLKVNKNSVDYVKWSNKNGPTYTISTDNVFMIKYANGDKDEFAGSRIAYMKGDGETHLAGKARFGVTAGMNVASISNSFFDSSIGLNVGVRGEYTFTDNVFLNAAFMFTQKGGRKRTDEYKMTATPAYLQIPIHVGYRSAIGRKCYVFGETGPYFAYGISGKLKYSESEYTYVDAYGIDWFGDDDDEFGGKRFDVGWGVRAGVECGGFQLHVGYEYGFITMLKDGKNHNNNIAVGVSCFF